jgi:hypothetical protein
MKNQILNKNHRKLIQNHRLLNIDLKGCREASNLLHQNKNLINTKYHTL